MPETPFSSAEKMTAVLRLTSMLASRILMRWLMVNHRHSGNKITSTSVSLTFIVNIRMIAPTIVSVHMRMFSGPWGASSVISNRSLVRRLITVPVRLRSK